MTSVLSTFNDEPLHNTDAHPSNHTLFPLTHPHAAKMPKSKREKVLHMSQVAKKTREHKDRLFNNVRDSVPEFEHCFVVRVDNMRNQYVKDVRQEMTDGR